MPRDTKPLPSRDAPDAPSWEPELDEAIFAAEAFPEPAERFVITSPSLAEWAMRKLAVLTKRAQDVKEQATAWRDQVNYWENRETQRLQRGLDFFNGHLEQYALDYRAKNPREATVRLPSGEISTRGPKQPTVQLASEDKVIAWAAETLEPELYETVVKTTEKVLISELRKLVETKRGTPDDQGNERWVVIWPGSGEVIPGLHAELGDTTATAKPTLQF